MGYKKILVTGGSGMLGKSLKNYLPNALFLNGRKEFDFTSEKISDEINSLDYFNYIIHCAAYTDISYCELNPHKAYKLHAETVKLLQKKCDKLIYISTNPSNSKKVYYQTKREGEKYVNQREGDLVIRTNIFGNGGLTKWAIESFKRKEKIMGYSNVVFNPIHVDQLSQVISRKIDSYRGFLNLGSITHISKYDFLKVLALSKKFNINLVEPMDIDGDVDLTVPLIGNFIKFNLMDGISKL